MESASRSELRDTRSDLASARSAGNRAPGSEGSVVDQARELARDALVEARLGDGLDRHGEQSAERALEGQ
jgi:hypothetical protein